MGARLKVVSEPAPYRIEKDVPVPRKRKFAGRVQEIIRQMDAGDSIRIPLDERIPARDVYDLQRRMSQAANNILGRGNYSVRIIEADAVRLWRLA